MSRQSNPFQDYPAEEPEWERIDWKYQPPTSGGALMAISHGGVIGLIGLIGAWMAARDTFNGDPHWGTMGIALVFGVLGSGLALIYAYESVVTLRCERFCVTVVSATPDWTVGDQPQTVKGRTIRIRALNRRDDYKPLNLVWTLDANHVVSMPPGREVKFYAQPDDGKWRVRFAEVGRITRKREFYQRTRLTEPPIAPHFRPLDMSGVDLGPM